MTSRERFEQSGITSLLSRSTEPGFTDEYADSHTQFAWRAWQAAERAALERAAEICDEAWKFEQDAGIAANAIRALIEQDKKETK